eukprot:CAMPEP_0118867822 /NCGR_PEP_ID=MMETSP1163-20130328/11283_1 /TAXON_ID=124430 /ORGANISM="Phaeomonas parva, Strain CCMP2877" /LENGTH=301 /DNA_ID=CAMNT_0006802285 /DNA_START=118 /DNA_END=1020 /DNA_ORIENTATION=-
MVQARRRNLRRERSRPPEERLAVDACRQLRRAAKVAKGFLLQKHIRRLKKRTRGNSFDGVDPSAAEQAVAKAGAENLEALKQLDLDGVLIKGLRWLGLPTDALEKLDQRPPPRNKAKLGASANAKGGGDGDGDADGNGDADDGDPDPKPKRVGLTAVDEELTEQLFKHPRVQECLLGCGDKLRELRRRQFAKAEGVAYVPLHKQKKQAAAALAPPPVESFEHKVGTTAIFMDSLDGGAAAKADEPAPLGVYGPGAGTEAKKKKKKKNRPGQRARRKDFDEAQQQQLPQGKGGHRGGGGGGG